MVEFWERGCFLVGAGEEGEVVRGEGVLRVVMVMIVRMGGAV